MSLSHLPRFTTATHETGDPADVEAYHETDDRDALVRLVEVDCDAHQADPDRAVYFVIDLDAPFTERVIGGYRAGTLNEALAHRDLANASYIDSQNAS